MRVAMDCRALGSGLGGDETMLRGFLRGLAVAAEEEDHFVLLVPQASVVPSDVLESGRFSVVPIARRPGVAHFGVVLPRALRALRPELQAAFSVTHAPVWGGVPAALMVNDISPLRDPTWYPAPARARLRIGLRFQVPRVANILTVSEFCKGEILTEFGLPADRVQVVPNTIEPPRPLDEAEEQACRQWLDRSGVDRPFLLYLGNLHVRKNVPSLIRGFLQARQENSAMAECQLVIAGAQWWGAGGEQELAAQAPGSVVLLGRVDDVQREFLLRHALALAYLSVYEGFGLPPVEAMARGTAVIAADRGSIPEVTGGAALLVEPFDLDAIAHGLTTLVTDTARRADLQQKGLAQAAKFSVEATGRAAVAALAAGIN